MVIGPTSWDRCTVDHAPVPTCPLSYCRGPGPDLCELQAAREMWEAGLNPVSRRPCEVQAKEAIPGLPQADDGAWDHHRAGRGPRPKARGAWRTASFDRAMRGDGGLSGCQPQAPLSLNPEPSAQGPRGGGGGLLRQSSDGTRRDRCGGGRRSSRSDRGKSRCFRCSALGVHRLARSGSPGVPAGRLQRCQRLDLVSRISVAGNLRRPSFDLGDGPGTQPFGNIQKAHGKPSGEFGDIGRLPQSTESGSDPEQTVAVDDTGAV